MLGCSSRHPVAASFQRRESLAGGWKRNVTQNKVTSEAGGAIVQYVPHASVTEGGGYLVSSALQGLYGRRLSQFLTSRRWNHALQSHLIFLCPTRRSLLPDSSLCHSLIVSTSFHLHFCCSATLLDNVWHLSDLCSTFCWNGVIAPSPGTLFFFKICTRSHQFSHLRQSLWGLLGKMTSQ